jgi:peptidyl-prolyl cis-trans isomerase A (cyclophilin A)
MQRTALLLVALGLACTKSATTGPAGLDPAHLDAQAPAVFKAKFVTTKGEFVVEVQRAWAPRGADRFYNLVNAGFYDGVKFFRAIKGFMVQFGIHGQPAVSRVWVNANIPDDPVKESNVRGQITFATGGPNTRTTQIFINLVDNKNLDGIGFSPFGKVVSGMDVVDKLYTGAGEGPPGGTGPDQNRIQAEGNAYLERDFPQLDAVNSATIVP